MTLNYLYVLIILAAIMLGAIALFYGKTSASKYFAAFVFSVVLWVFSNLMVDNTSDSQSLFFWINLAIVGPIFLAPFFLAFTIVFLEKSDKKLTFLKFILLLLPSLAFLPFVFTEANVSNVNINPDGAINFQPGILYGVLFFYVLLYVGVGIINLIRKFRKSTGLDRIQLGMITAAFFVSFIIAIVATLFLPIIGFSEVGIVGPISSFLFIIVATYAIFRYRLFDVRLILGRITYFSMVAIFAFIAFHIVIILVQTIFGDFYSLGALSFGAIAAVTFVLAYDYLNKFVKERVESTIIYPNYDPNEELARFNSSISTTLNYEEIVGKVGEIVLKTVRPGFIAVIIQNTKGETQVLGEHIEMFDVNSPDIRSLMDHFATIDSKVFNMYQLENETPPEMQNLSYILPTIKNNMQSLKIKVAIPFQKQNNRFIGMLLLGAKTGDTFYSRSETNFLNSLAEVTAVSLARSFLYEEVQQFNVTLQQKVDDATKELKVANEQLAESLRKERDMMDILGHELRTPLGTARNSIVMVYDKHKNNQLTKADLDKYLKMAVDNIRREKDLLETILQSARLENDRVQINVEPVKATDMVEDSIVAFTPEAQKKKLELNSEIKVEAATAVTADKTAIQQVLDNLVSNAVKYTPAGSVTIIVEQAGESGVRFAVKDTGEGIASENIPNLGKKFFRINPHLESDGTIGGRKIVRPGGTGIGLYVIKGLLEAMGSSLNVQSEGVGKGSVFSFVLPVYSEESAKAVERKNEVVEQAKLEKNPDNSNEIHPSELGNLAQT